MKTERRQELQTNVLADRMNDYGDQLRPYSKQIVLACGAVVAIFAVSMFLISDQSARLSSGWSDLFAASSEANPNPERLRTVADEHAGTVAGAWAMLNEADIELSRGMRLLYTDRVSANEALDRAIESYGNALNNPSRLGSLQLSARYGLAQALECRGEIDDAVAEYQRVLANSDAEETVAMQAKQRIEALEDPDMRRFYNWFANQKPAPPQNPGSLPGFNLPDLPSDLGQIPDTPDFSIPSNDVPDTEEVDSTSDDAPSDEAGETDE